MCRRRDGRVQADEIGPRQQTINVDQLDTGKRSLLGADHRVRRDEPRAKALQAAGGGPAHRTKADQADGLAP